MVTHLSSFTLYFGSYCNSYILHAITYTRNVYRPSIQVNNAHNHMTESRNLCRYNSSVRCLFYPCFVRRSHWNTFKCNYTDKAWLVFRFIQNNFSNIQEVVLYILTSAHYSFGTSDTSFVYIFFARKIDKSKRLQRFVKHTHYSIPPPSNMTLTVEDGNAVFYSTI